MTGVAHFVAGARGADASLKGRAILEHEYWGVVYQPVGSCRAGARGTAPKMADTAVDESVVRRPVGTTHRFTQFRLATDIRERRRKPRYLLTRPLVAIPITLANRPDRVQAAEGISLDLAERGIGFELAGVTHLPTARMVIGVEADDDQYYFATIRTCTVQSLPGGLRIGAKFVTPDDDPLAESKLLPTLDSATGRLVTALPAEIADLWVERGVLEPYLLDRVLVCPRCGGLPTFREACRACGSVQVVADPLVHHFACAYVGSLGEFQVGDELVCPKCHRKPLVVGADFEHARGPYQCLDCAWTDADLELAAQCLACEHRFPRHHAGEQELVAYYVNRLDPLAFLAAS